VDLERLDRVVRRATFIEVLDDAIRRHGRAAMHEQDHEQPLLLGAQGERSTVPFDLERSEDPYLHFLRGKRL
jgi:hypothetical protein